MLEESGGPRGRPKTSGGRGVHVLVPIEPCRPSTRVRRAAVAAGREPERRSPRRVTTVWWKEERGERVFVDHHQTARDRTVASACSGRPRPRAPVSAPLRREEAGDAHPRAFGITAMPARFAELGDVHADMDDHARSPDAPPELAAKDERDHGLGDLPYPPECPKTPDEPGRVRPSRARKPARGAERATAP